MQAELHYSVWLQGHAWLDQGRQGWAISSHDALQVVSTTSTDRIRATPCARHVSLWLRRDHLSALAAGRDKRLSEGIQYWSRPVVPAGVTVLRLANELAELLGCDGNCTLLRDAKCMELLAQLLDHPGQASNPALPPTRRARLQQARTLLLSNLAEPLSTEKLARACGLNSFHLKQGFRQLFGQSVRACHQAARMRRAWQLIASGETDVSHAGQQLGYTNLSHFSAAFARHFGLRPSELKRCTRMHEHPPPPPPPPAPRG